MSRPKQCDGCGALRCYGMPLHEERAVTYPGPIEHVVFLCEICCEQRNIACWEPEWEPYQPTMHPPHMSKQ